MDDRRWLETADIINYGLASQKDMAALNSVATSVIRNRDYDRVLKCFDELLKVSAEAEAGKLAQKEQHIDRIKEEFLKSRIEILKEANLLKELRHTNEAYIGKIVAEIAEAQKYCDGHPYDPAKKADAQMELLKKRIYELTTSKIVAENFSAQLKLSEDNSFDMAEKIWNALVTIVPLLKGNISLETGRSVITGARKLIEDNMSAIISAV